MAALTNKIQGSLILFGLNGSFPKCQIDATFESTININELPTCKPMAGEAYIATNPAEYEVTGSSWSVSMSARAFAEGTSFNQGDILEAIASGQVFVPIVFATTQTSNYDKEELQTITGDAILTSFSWNAPSDGDSTYDITLQGNGAFTLTRVPYTT